MSGCESPIEELFYAGLCGLCGLQSRVIRQHRVGPYRVDFLVVAEPYALVIECDGYEFHSSVEQIRRDRQREREIIDHGRAKMLDQQACLSVRKTWPQAPWVIVMAEPGADERVERALWASGYRVYLPRFRRLLRHAGSTLTPLRPAMPGYLFVSDWQGWPSRPIAGVTGLMRRYDSNKARELDDADVQILWDAERTGAWDEVESGYGRRRKRTDLKAGQEVELVLFGDRIRGVIDRLSDTGKAILKDIMTAQGWKVSARMTVNADELDKVAS